MSLVDLNDAYLRFNLREDLVKDLKVGDRFQVHVPALGNRLVTAAVKFIAPIGEYAGWRATRATGDFDLRTFQVRAYPVEPLPAKTSFFAPYRTCSNADNFGGQSSPGGRTWRAGN